MFTKRKFKKLFSDPKLFFSDMFLKHHRKINRLKGRKKHEGEHYFTVVSAVYGVDKYLNDYFESLINQSLNFKKHIQLILVDDGSIDNSAAIIKYWRKKYPKNIIYVRQENKGQASARNLGLQFVKTEWVTFIDPDDFVSNDYFYQISSFLSHHKNVAFIGCNLYFYIENKNIYKNNHPLNYKFKDKTEICSCTDLGDNVQMSSSSAFFLNTIIKDHNLFFDAKIRPSFEDASFISHYLFYANKRKAAFLQSPKYFYRKREDSSSTLDSSWTNPKKFSDVFIYGYIPLCTFYKDKVGKVPKHIQRQVLYDLVWYLKYLLNSDNKIDFLPNKSKEDFYENYNKILSFIDKDTIWSFNLAKTWFLYKVLLLNLKKDSDFKQITYIERYDSNRQSVFFSVIGQEYIDISFRVNGKDTSPLTYKKIPQKFANKTIGYVHYFWVTVNNNHGALNVLINGQNSRISFKGEIYNKEIDLTCFTQKNINSDLWVFMDRADKADDNAEHLYRYVKNNELNKNICFILRKDSADWDRLEQEGFNLISFDSKGHQLALESSSRIISSHAEWYIHNYLPDNKMLNKHFVFLQHGITQNDLSNWLNVKKNIDLFITCTKPEHNSIASPNSPYIFTNREVKLLGFPRHDSLWKNQRENVRRVILVMPTWRSNIIGSEVGVGNQRARNNLFSNTSYYYNWNSFLSSDELKKICEHHNYEVIFQPHKNIEEYLDLFDIPAYITVKSSNVTDGSIQDLFHEASFMITDYSSVSFEMAYINKKTIYFQFDENEIFSGLHTFRRGYFNYEQHGFGPKVLTLEDLYLEVDKMCGNKGVLTDKYLKRIQDTFAYQDSNNCKRVYQEICKLDEPLGVSNIDLTMLYSLAKSTYFCENYPLSMERFESILEIKNQYKTEQIYGILLDVYFKTFCFEKLDNLISKFNSLNDDIYRAKRNLAYVLGEKQAVVLNNDFISNKTLEDYVLLIMYFSFYENTCLSSEYYNEIKNKCSDDKVQYLLRILSFIVEKRWDKVIYESKCLLSKLSRDEVKVYKPQIFMSIANRKLDCLEEAHLHLLDYEKYKSNDFDCRCEIISLAFQRKNYLKVITQLKILFSNEEDMTYMSKHLFLLYFKSLCFLGKNEEAKIIYKKLNNYKYDPNGFLVN